MIQENEYYYNEQLRTYILQFMAIFAGLQVKVGQSADAPPRLINVPIVYGDHDRVVSSILADNTQNKVLRLPAMSAYLRNLSLSKDRMVGTGAERRNSYVPVGGLVPDDISVIHQRRPICYDAEIELFLYASNTDQMFQMLEQILPLFDPQLSIQRSDGPFDMGRITHVELTSISKETQYPSGTARRLVQHTLVFNMPVYIHVPAIVRKNFIEKIFLRIGAVNNGAITSEEMLASLDAQGLDYELVVSSDDVDVT